LYNLKKNLIKMNYAHFWQVIKLLVCFCPTTESFKALNLSHIANLNMSLNCKFFIVHSCVLVISSWCCTTWKKQKWSNKNYFGCHFLFLHHRFSHSCPENVCIEHSMKFVYSICTLITLGNCNKHLLHFFVLGVQSGYFLGYEFL